MSKPRRGSGPDFSWLKQFDVDGPFLSLPVVKAFWPSGVDRLGDADDRLVTFKQGFTVWLRAYDQQSLEKREQYAETARAWVDTVLDELAGWDGLRIGADELPAEFEIHSPGEQVRIRANGGLRGRESGEIAALLRVVSPTGDLRGPGLDGWAATEIDRMAALLRQAGVPIGLVTDGRWWGIVWAEHGTATGSGIVDAVMWGEEPLLRDAFLTLIDQQLLRAKNPDHRLPRLLQRSELEAEEITEALGTQVRKSVELLVQAFSETRLIAAENDEPDPLTEKPDDVYQAAVTVMMRVVFLLFAEERGMLPTERLYWDSYAIRELLDDLKGRALAHGEEHLDETQDVWHRLLAVSDALYSGVNYDEMRMPAYGGSLLDPNRFPWLTATDQHGLRVQVSDRVMLHVLQSVQEATVRGEARRISFRDIDVEQIGYIYEGLLGYTCATVTDDVVVGLVGKDGEEPEITLSQLNVLRENTSGTKAFVDKLIESVKKDQPAASMKTAAQLVKLTDATVDEAELRRLLTPVAGHDQGLLTDLIRWGNLIRRDLRGIPLVVPPGGLVVVETPSRRNAGAHYTPRSLAEEVVKYALEPVVYEPGPLQTNDVDAWKLKSSTAILDLKVADIAAGSGAFLVAAARFLAKRVTEAWTEEGMLSDAELANPLLAEERAIREVVARCLYGADINPMAVEMCKLSLWLVSLDKTKPFSFVDDKILCGNSLLGVTTLDQLRHLHIDPDRKRKFLQPFVDVDAVLAEATRLRRELASPVDNDDPQRSTAGKLRLLRRADEVTAQLRLMADGIIAAGLALGGKPGPQLENAYKSLEWALVEALPSDGSTGNPAKLDAILAKGLTPTVDTDYDRWQPLHWAIEVSDVIERGGFDAIIGNPPFLGGTKISAVMGGNMRDWLPFVLAGGQSGSADLAAYFFLRAMELANKAASIGLIATNSIGQGRTREVGLDRMVGNGFTILRSIQSRPWPAQTANLEYAAVWGSVGEVSGEVPRYSDGEAVRRISTLLEPIGTVEGTPYRLPENADIAFEGCKPYGKGFIIDPTEAIAWLAEDSRYSEVLFPFTNGEDLNSRPDTSASRWVINFDNRTEDEAKAYEKPYVRVLKTVKPERATNKRAARRDRWWQFGERAAGMQRAIAGLDEVLVIAKVSRTIMPVRVKTRQVFSDKVNVFATDSYIDQAALSSTFHQLWAMKYSTTMRTDPSYAVTAVFETFPRPKTTSWLENMGRRLDVQRREIMMRRGLGLTSLYNLFHDLAVEEHADPDIAKLRDIHVELDQAMLDAYDWTDVKLDHGFHTYRQMERFSVSPAVRVEILDRLLEENHRRAGVNTDAMSAEQEDLFA
ncbi:SAM-dependent DNA methyltransferase [Mycobacterium avium subsp. hominissuis]|uniref:Eco57I restriction-modification methylase domain-containing protein n=1 Tax=Mycobacterium avium TaxID=1764 RepID=UPI001CC6FCF4|nr:DNA methyltransferase [Mycobacterium avium]MBZ4557576.1 SAM-dependent DNA methyltransferase [Mycobacterium avium subsp. hominissuis]MBZ4567316.1 SAM-dependent DNA methyltransferase [Mycobacterium avium subsp. hominissuis]MBZ4586153.1 SAM-dependent DNA methyltransferase [Mycobacterium avium subsp. hominissuis]MBZ4624049.1 SAM-dependent DNA methyltransferase [Mycobacterium avium subsp. hominissuis]